MKQLFDVTKRGTSLLLALIAGLSVFTTLALPAMAQAGNHGSYQGHGMFHGGWGWSGMIFGPVLMIVIVVLIVVVAVLVVRWMGGLNPTAPSQGPRSNNQAIDILRERFARGEIDAEEFESKRRTLNE